MLSTWHHIPEDRDLQTVTLTSVSPIMIQMSVSELHKQMLKKMLMVQFKICHDIHAIWEKHQQ